MLIMSSNYQHCFNMYLFQNSFYDLNTSSFFTCLILSKTLYMNNLLKMMLFNLQKNFFELLQNYNIKTHASIECLIILNKKK